MNVLILGYGFSGFYCAEHLLREGHQVGAISRHYSQEYQLEKLQHEIGDLNHWSVKSLPDVIIYCVPPARAGKTDDLITRILDNLWLKEFVGHFIYWGSSAVYGNHHGELVTEKSSCYLTSDVQRRRLHAEEQVNRFAKKSGASISILRMSGLFGAERLPKTDRRLINRIEAPYSNLVFIEDAARLMVEVIQRKNGVGVINVSDGIIKKMGDLQRMVAMLQGESIVDESYEKVMETASNMKRFFLSSSKQLSIDKLHKTFPDFQFTNFKDAVKRCLRSN